MNRILFFLLAAFALSPWSSPAVSLLLGLLFALTLGQPYPKQSKVISKYTLQAAVVGLGFGLDFMTILRVGAQGFLLTLITISLTLAIGLLLGRWLHVERKARTLISVGTAICGGSAIAAVGPVINASDEEMSVSLGTVFILNAIALFLFPPIGHALHMSEPSFGLWAALAIHDTSSVVGAAASYGKQALEIGTTIKLTRALWIIPVALFFAYLEHRQIERDLKVTTTTGTSRPKLQIPWFIGLFVLASLIRSFIPDQTTLFNAIIIIAKSLLSLTLFLIGAGLSRKALQRVGVRPLLNGVVLWIIVGISTLVAITAFSIQ
jgi:uncharacterized integral membrane protein (TIGR00698 family)